MSVIYALATPPAKSAICVFRVSGESCLDLFKEFFSSPPKKERFFYLKNFYFDGEPLLVGLFLGTSIHETSQVAAAGLIYEQQFNSPETLNIATVTKLIRNTFLVIMIPLFAFLYNRGNVVKKNYSIISIFPYFVLGFIGMIIVRNLGDYYFIESNNQVWTDII